MDLDEFLSVALRKGLGTADELMQFAIHWHSAYANDEPGFCDEITLEDWTGSLHRGNCAMVLLRHIPESSVGDFG